MLTDVAEHMTEAQEILATDEIFRHLVVQRSRAYARESQIRETGKAAAFPGAQGAAGRGVLDPQDLRPAARHVREGLHAKNPLFTLPMYYPLAWYKGPDTSIDPVRGRTDRSRSSA